MTVGGRGSYSSANGEPDALGGGLYFVTHGYTSSSSIPLRAARARAVISPGVGEAGFDGEFVYDLAVGHRLSLGDQHGPFIRGGFVAEALRSRVLATKVELPQLQAGYQFMDRNKLHAELGARGGLVLIGRQNITNSSRRPLGGSISWGGYAAAGIEVLRAEVEVNRYEAHTSAPETPVYAIKGQLCALPQPLMICGDVRHYRGDQQLDAGGEGFRTGWYGAATVSWQIPLAHRGGAGAVPER